jgi:hypothetical protein
MADIFDDDGNRLPMTFMDLELNSSAMVVDSGKPDDPTYGAWVDSAVYNTPIVFQSEAQPDIIKQGGGIEVYNPRVATRVLDIRGRILAPTRKRVGSVAQLIRQNLSPLHLMWDHSNSWPPPGGRPAWTDPWQPSLYSGLSFTRMLDGRHESGFRTSFPDGKVPLQHAVFPLVVSDAPVFSVQQGYSTDFHLQFLLLDGGIAFSQTQSSRTGTGAVAPSWSDVPAYPEISFTMSGAGSATWTLAVTNVQGYSPTDLVLDLSGRSNTEVIRVNCRDRKIYVDGVETPGIYVSGDYPVVPSDDYSATYTFTNTTNCGTITTSWWETLAA